VTTARGLMWGLVAVGAAANCAIVIATRSATVRSIEPPTPTFFEQADAPALFDRPGVPAGPEFDGDVPADQLEHGDAALRVCVRVDPGGVATAMRVRLWHLGVPGNDAWTGGDESRGTFELPQSGATIDHLPPGRYRLQRMDYPPRGEDPPEFAVAGGWNDRVVTVVDRLEFRVPVARVANRATTGLLCGTCARIRNDRDLYWRFGGPPTWAAPRAPKSPR
jgi:hypothetical protein